MELANQSCRDIVFRLLGLHPRVLRAQRFKLLLSYIFRTEGQSELLNKLIRKLPLFQCSETTLTIESCLVCVGGVHDVDTFAFVFCLSWTLFYHQMKALAVEYCRVACISDSNSLVQNYPPNVPLNVFDWTDVLRSQTWLILVLQQTASIRTWQEPAEAAFCWASVASQPSVLAVSSIVSVSVGAGLVGWVSFLYMLSPKLMFLRPNKKPE